MDCSSPFFSRTLLPAPKSRSRFFRYTRAQRPNSTHSPRAGVCVARTKPRKTASLVYTITHRGRERASFSSLVKLNLHFFLTRRVLFISPALLCVGLQLHNSRENPSKNRMEFIVSAFLPQKRRFPEVAPRRRSFFGRKSGWRVAG